MKRNFLIVLLLTAATALGLSAQVTSEPSPLQEDSPDVAVFFHADQGNKGLAGLKPTDKVYAHTGACLSNGENWVNAPKWGDNNDKFLLTYVSENLWRLEIGDIRKYYGITDPSVSVTRLAFVFRSADCKKEGKGTGNTDIFIDVVDSGLQISLESSVDGTLVTPQTGAVTFKVASTAKADLSLSVNGTEIASAKEATALAKAYSFPSPGNYVVRATATAGGKGVTTEKNFCYARNSQAAAYPWGEPQMGPRDNGDGSVTFCLGAPGKKNVIIVGAWNGYEVTGDGVMDYVEKDGLRWFWTTVKGLDRTTMYGYYFLVDGEIRVGDPYARLVLDPWNDKYLATGVFPGLPDYPFTKLQNVPLAVWQGSLNDYQWEVNDFKGVPKDELVIYEMLLRDFTGTEGKSLGNGTVRGAMEKIPYLKELGVNAVELLPICEFNGNISWGYNPNFYFAPDKAYGTPRDYKEFIDACHKEGIAVILDMVFNQSDGEHPWYRMYPPGENPFYNLDAPHAYSVLNDWNQGHPMVACQWDDVLSYWLENYHVDGFRFDLVKGLGDNASYAGNGSGATDAYNQSRIDRMRRLQETVGKINPDAYFINEDLATAKEESELAKTGQLCWANVNTQGSRYACGESTDSELIRFYAPLDQRPLGSTVSYLESHDEQRLAAAQNQFGVTGVKGNLRNSMHRLGAAAAWMLMSPGAHMIWQFSEMGNYDSTKTAEGGNNTDPKPVRWNLLDNADRKGLAANYSELNAIRREYRLLFSEQSEIQVKFDGSAWTTGRTMRLRNGSTELHTVVNPNVDKEITVKVDFSFADNAAYKIVSKSYGTEPEVDAKAKTVTVPANCYVVVATTGQGTSGVDDTLETDSGLRVETLAGELIVSGAAGAVAVVGTDGRTVARLSGNGSVSVPPGFYLVVSGNQKKKVMVP